MLICRARCVSSNGTVAWFLEAARHGWPGGDARLACGSGAGLACGGCDRRLFRRHRDQTIFSGDAGGGVGINLQPVGGIERRNSLAVDRSRGDQGR